MNRTRLLEILESLPKAKIAVLGDFFLDRYFVIDASLSELSVETALTAHQVVERRLSPGAAGNVVVNLRDLGIGEVHCIGIIGADGEGYELKAGLVRCGADISGLVELEDRFTPCYTKPMLLKDGKETEMERLDIKNRKALPKDAEDSILATIVELLPIVDAIIITDQVQERNTGSVTDRIRKEIADLAKANPQKVFFADSRARLSEFSDYMLKPNMFEAVDAVLGNARPDNAALGSDDIDLEQAQACAKALYARSGRPVFLTAQEEGIFVVDEQIQHVPAVIVDGEIDPVGAGDSCAAGIVSGLSVGATNEEAAFLGNIVASITVHKLGCTGTATPSEIMARFDDSLC